METWQTEIITRDLPLLLHVDFWLLSRLKANDLLSATEVQQLHMRPSNSEKCTELLNLLVTRIGAFDSLITILEACEDTRAAEILKKGKITTYENRIKDALEMGDPAAIVMIANEWVLWKSWSISGGEINLRRIEYEKEISFRKPLSMPAEFYLEEIKSSDYQEYVHVVRLNKKKEENLAIIINITEFSSETTTTEDIREGSEHDVVYMRSICKALGYRIWNENAESGKFTRSNILRLMKKFVEECLNELPKSILVFIGSHGEHGRIFTSDRWQCPLDDRSIDPLTEIVYIFGNNSNTKNDLKSIPKIFILNACQCFPSMQSDSIRIEGQSIDNAIVCHSQIPGGKSWRCTLSGSWFVHCFAFCMSRLAKERDFVSIMIIVVELLMKRKGLTKGNKIDARQVDEEREYGQAPCYYPLNLTKRIIFRKLSEDRK